MVTFRLEEDQNSALPWDIFLSRNGQGGVEVRVNNEEDLDGYVLITFNQDGTFTNEAGDSYDQPLGFQVDENGKLVERG